ncbi:MAG: hypothetical protein WC376_03980 [Candidatus Nanoarchaeia archaeon]|jgi:hypothetical protein
MDLEKKLKEYKEKDIHPAHEVLDYVMQGLELSPKDILHVAALRLNENIQRSDKKWNTKTELLNMNNYRPENYEQGSWESYVKELSNPDKVKFDFQILLYTITSEKLLREYFYKKYMGKNNKSSAEMLRDRKSHAELVSSFASDIDNLRRPNGNSFQIKNYDLSDYLNSLKDKMWDGADAQVLIDDLLNNLAEFYVFTEGYSF